MNYGQVLNRYFDAMNAERWDEFANRVDTRLRGASGRGETAKGVEEIVEFYSGLFSPWQTHVDTPTRVIAEASTWAVEVTFSGVSRSGAAITFDAVDIIDFAGGTIAKLTNWYDLAFVRRQLASDGDGQ